MAYKVTYTTGFQKGSTLRLAAARSSILSNFLCDQTIKHLGRVGRSQWLAPI